MEEGDLEGRGVESVEMGTLEREGEKERAKGLEWKEWVCVRGKMYQSRKGAEG